MTRLAVEASAGRKAPAVLRPRGILLCLVLASGAVIGTVIASQYWGGLMPCELCFYERWPYYAAIVLGGAALLAGSWLSRPALFLMALLFAGGAILAFYHVGVEQHWFAGPSACTDSGGADSVAALTAQLMGRQPILCDQPAWTFHGLSLAAFNLVASLLLLGVSLAGLAPARSPHLEIP